MASAAAIAALVCGDMKRPAMRRAVRPENLHAFGGD